MRTILMLAGLLAVGAAPVTAAAQHAAAPTPAAHAIEAPKKPEVKAVAEVKPAAKEEKPGKPGEKAPEKASEKASAKAAAARKGAPFSDLEAAFDRIAQKIQGAEVMPGGLRISSGSPVAPERAAESRPAEAKAARGELTPRIHLIWRSAVVWPDALGPADAPGTASTSDSARITLDWQ